MISKTQSKSIKRPFSYLKNQATIENCFVVKERKNDIKKGSNAYNKAAHAIASAFAANSSPFLLIEEPSIKNMFAVVSEGRLLTLPNQHDISTKVSELVKELKRSVELSLNSAKYVSITTDGLGHVIHR